MGQHLSQRDWFFDTGQRIPCFDSCQLTTTWMCNITLQAPTLARKSDISLRFPVLLAEGLTVT